MEREDMMKGSYRFTLLLLLGFCVSTLASPSSNVWWDRSDNGAVYAEWYFTTPDNPAMPEEYSGPGTPTALVDASGVSHFLDPGWYATYLGKTGVWHGDLTMINLSLDNIPIANPYKEIWVTVCFRGELLPSDNYPDFPADEYGPKVTPLVPGGVADVMEIGRYFSVDQDMWRILEIGWRIYPNPLYEDIFLAFHNSGADIDYIIVDTICIPEPATLLILGLGSVLLLAKRRQ
jgi:hypothetical protein